MHVALIFGWLLVHHPNIEEAEKLSEPANGVIKVTCLDFAKEMDSVLYLALVTHILCTVSCFYQEIFETQTGLIAIFGSAAQILSVGLYNGLIFYCMVLIARYFSNARAELHHCYSDFKEFSKWNGTTLQWFSIEICVYFTYLLTMLIMLLKSQFTRVGADNSKMFEARYMSYMANKLTEDFIK